jgi:hypothetical protein
MPIILSIDIEFGIVVGPGSDSGIGDGVVKENRLVGRVRNQ